MKTTMTINHVKGIFLLIFCVFCLTNNLSAQSNDHCFMCHEDPEMTMERNGRTISIFMDSKSMKSTVHENVSCVACHKDAAGEDGHPEKLKRVQCGSCHKQAKSDHYSGMHGMAYRKGDRNAPSCKSCHGKHKVYSEDDKRSPIYKLNIPVLCGKCHKEGSPTKRGYKTNRENVAENYSQNIHGEGLYENGLTVTATCSDCHSSHKVLPSKNPGSTVSDHKVTSTCMSCHTSVKKIHEKIFKADATIETQPNCVSCHIPHNKTSEKISISDQQCLDCHNEDVVKDASGKAISELKMNLSHLSESVHKDLSCVNCHLEAEHKDGECMTQNRVDCSSCHAEAGNIYMSSGHGEAYINKDENAPYCTDCHGTHLVKHSKDETAPTYRTAIPGLCGECHKEDGKAVEHSDLKEVNALYDYSMSVHGKSLKDKGLSITAVCTDCHTTHFMLDDADERSSVHPRNIPKTCAKCHEGVYNEYIKSDHAFSSDKGDLKFPSCADCHSAHQISEIDQGEFMYEVTSMCGSCHQDLTDTYMDTYHGKAFQLGSKESARCSDCHGAHNILKQSNPKSMISSENIVATCAQCHEGANKQFTGYLNHATHDDDPILYYTFWGMTSLLIGVFGFFGLHTLMWLPRSLRQRRKHKKIDTSKEIEYVRRFSPIQRVTHIFIILSFIFLALTGMALKFADQEWAKFLMKIFGGVYNAGFIHRIGAVITFGYFGFHVYNLFKIKRSSNMSFMKFAFGRDSLMFNKQDIKDFVATVKWFLAKGPRPQYGRWTYWEKFDYMAVFWGVAVIGFSGLVLWFPVFFTSFLPGWAINVAQIIHSDEALLAVGFIFTIHFFNTHFRPEAFPMDTVIFTGHVPLEEFKADRPREYEELKEEGRLDKLVSKIKYSKRRMFIIRTFGFTMLAIGISLVILIVYSLLG